MSPPFAACRHAQAQRGVVTELQGYLLKQSSSVRADWKRRFFFLTADGELRYCRNARVPRSCPGPRPESCRGLQRRRPTQH